MPDQGGWRLEAAGWRSHPPASSLRPSAFLAIWLIAASTAIACPFCTALGPTLSQQRDTADMAAIGEVESIGERSLVVRMHKVLVGAAESPADNLLEIPIAEQTAGEGGSGDRGPGTGDRGRSQPAVGSLVLLLGKRVAAETSTNDDRASEATANPEWQWTLIPLNEASYAYVARAPSTRIPAEKRLVFFAKYLEHADPLVASDAYLEFGHAPFDQVERIAGRLPMGAIRRWILDPAVPAERKGLYGLLLGLGRDDERRRNTEILKRLVTEPSGDFRAGYDGVLGGFLMAAGLQGLELVEREILDNPDAATGDIKHAATALRFYHEYGREIERSRLSLAMRKLISRPETAATAIVELTRWQDWEALDQVVAVFERPGFDGADIDQSVVGYLLVCPIEKASDELARIRQIDADRVGAAEGRLARLGIVR